MIGKIRTLLSLWKDIEQIKADASKKKAQADFKYKTQIEQLQEEIKLRDIQIKNLVAENQRNFERIKAETAAFSAEVVKATMQQ